MNDDIFERLEQTARSQGAGAALDILIAESLRTKQYALLFQARLMRTKHALGLPLIETAATANMPPQQRAELDKAFVEAAREAGNLFLENGDIPSAWPFFRAIGDPVPVAGAIDAVSGGDNLDQVIEIAFHQGVNAAKGFQLLLEHYGICRGITFFGVYPDAASRQQSLQLLTATLYSEWKQNEYVDPSHLSSVLAFSIDLEDGETLRKTIEMADWGRKLPSELMLSGDPPFEDTYNDYGIYLRALLNENVDEAVAHFRKKVDGEERRPAEILVRLLVRLGRFDEAIQVSQEYLSDDSGVFQLCQMAGAYKELQRVAKERGDLLAFAAGVIQA